MGKKGAPPLGSKYKVGGGQAPAAALAPSSGLEVGTTATAPDPLCHLPLPASTPLPPLSHDALPRKWSMCWLWPPPGQTAAVADLGPASALPGLRPRLPLPQPLLFGRVGPELNAPDWKGAWAGARAEAGTGPGAATLGEWHWGGGGTWGAKLREGKRQEGTGTKGHKHRTGGGRHGAGQAAQGGGEQAARRQMPMGTGNAGETGSKGRRWGKGQAARVPCCLPPVPCAPPLPAPLDAA